MSQVAANPWAPSAPETWEAGILGRWSGFQNSSSQGTDAVGGRRGRHGSLSVTHMGYGGLRCLDLNSVLELVHGVARRLGKESVGWAAGNRAFLRF